MLCVAWCVALFVLMLRRLPRPTLFPYTTLFRSWHVIPRYKRDGRWGQPIWAPDVRAQPERKLADDDRELALGDRKSTRLNSSHLGISYAVFCLKKKIITPTGRGSFATTQIAAQS